MPENETFQQTATRDLVSGIVVFLVALPLCLGVALASGAPAIAGLIAGIVGGIVVGLLSGSNTSVSGPAAGLTAVVAVQIGSLGFETFLLAVVIAGGIQIAFGACRLGFVAGFFPSCVIKGLLAAIGIILILKQIPHLLGHDTDPEGEFAFEQRDGENTFSELMTSVGNIEGGSLVIGLASLAILILWGRSKTLKHSIVPAPLIVVAFGTALVALFDSIGGTLQIGPSHLVNVPKLLGEGAVSAFTFPSFSRVANSAVWLAGLTIALVASLETLLNLEAVDKLDPRKRHSPPDRELMAQGVGNLICGSIGGLPVTSVIVRSSVNILAGNRTRASAIVHGVLLLVFVVALPSLMNMIPLSCLAAILIVTGYKLASVKLFQGIWKQGINQFLPFVITVLAIVFTDLLIGIGIGFAASVAFILRNNLKRPLRRIREQHVSGELLHIQLSSQVTFLNRATVMETLEAIQPGQKVLIDASESDFIDIDILEIINAFDKETAPQRGIEVSLVGFQDYYEVDDKIRFADFTSREVRETLTPEGVLKILQDGNQRFVGGQRLSRDFGRQVLAGAKGQFPLAAVLSCIDSRAPVELVFDVGLGDLFSCRVAGNVIGPVVLGSLEYAAGPAGVKLIVVMGHTKCGAVTEAVNLSASGKTAAEVIGAGSIDSVIEEIAKAADVASCRAAVAGTEDERSAYIDEVAYRNVHRTMRVILERSSIVRSRVESGALQVVGAVYNVSTGRIVFQV